MRLCPCGNPSAYPSEKQRSNLCRGCRSKRSNEWNKKNKRRVQDAKLKRKFGIDISDYDRMLAAQGGTCAICREPNPHGWALAVDHNHTTGQVRSLLCHNCNVGIGNLRESPAILQRAIDYLNSHNLNRGENPCM